MPRVYCNHEFEPVLNGNDVEIGQRCKWACGEIRAFANCTQCRCRFVIKRRGQKKCNKCQGEEKKK